MAPPASLSPERGSVAPPVLRAPTRRLAAGSAGEAYGDADGGTRFECPSFRDVPGGCTQRPAIASCPDPTRASWPRPGHALVLDLESRLSADGVCACLAKAGGDFLQFQNRYKNDVFWSKNLVNDFVTASATTANNEPSERSRRGRGRPKKEDGANSKNKHELLLPSDFVQLLFSLFQYGSTPTEVCRHAINHLEPVWEACIRPAADERPLNLNPEVWPLPERAAFEIVIRKHLSRLLDLQEELKCAACGHVSSATCRQKQLCAEPFRDIQVSRHLLGVLDVIKKCMPTYMHASQAPKAEFKLKLQTVRVYIVLSDSVEKILATPHKKAVGSVIQQLTPTLQRMASIDSVGCLRAIGDQGRLPFRSKADVQIWVDNNLKNSLTEDTLCKYIQKIHAESLRITSEIQARDTLKKKREQEQDTLKKKRRLFGTAPAPAPRRLQRDFKTAPEWMKVPTREAMYPEWQQKVLLKIFPTKVPRPHGRLHPPS